MPNPGDNNYIKKDIASTLERYPLLTHHVSLRGQDILEGQIDLTDEGQNIVDSFQIRLIYTKKFPYAYPKAVETTTRFSKNQVDLHINGDGTLCLNSEPDEATDTHSGMSTVTFIKNVLLPNLAWRVCKLEKLDVELQEFSHGSQGTLESYKQMLNIPDSKTLLLYLVAYQTHALPSRNVKCICGSQKKFKHCHNLVKNKLALIPDETLARHIAELKSLIKI